MAELKIICTHCGQHIVCDDQWAGHQIQCPACQNQLVVPQNEPAPASASLPPPVTEQPSAPGRPRLSSRATQVTRRPAPISSQRKGVPPRRAKSGNFAGYIVLIVGLAVGGWAAYTYLPGLINQVQESSTSKAPASSTSGGGGGGGGPLGEANAAMDVSETLDGGGSAPSRPRVDAAKRLITGQPAPPATNTASKSPKAR